jgi:hypothetical protein
VSRKYTIDYFIAKFESIPLNRWTTKTFRNQLADGTVQCCALGHCRGPELERTQESDALDVILRKRTFEINDGFDPKYRQKSPRNRILAALEAAKAKAGGRA